MSKRKKQVYAAIVMVVGATLALDRLTGAGGTAPAVVAGAPETASHPAAEAGVRRGAPSGYVLSPARFPVNLPVDHGGARDIFGLTTVTRRALLQDPNGHGAAGEQVSRAKSAEERRFLSPAERFRKRHTVSAVVSGGAFTAAFVDGIWMVVGQRLDGCDLVRISGHTVVFDCADEEVELSVDTGLLSVQGGPEGAADDLKAGRGEDDILLD